MLNLYETYYKLSADPFRLSPDHDFAYGHKGYANAKAYLEYAFFQGEGFVMVTGEPGTGKTTLINEILAGLDQSRLQVATLTTTQLDTRDLLHMVAVLLGMQVTEVSKPALLMDLKKYLTAQADRGWRSILVVDEAQGLSSSGLEELRLLANLQHRNRLLIQICLIGQDQLRDLVQTPEMEHLRQRIIAASHLTPLSLEETVDYIEHRLQHAGWKGDPGISEGALREIHRHSGGIPRLINLICNRLFLYGGLESMHAFDTGDARHVIGELLQEQLLHGEHLGEDTPEFTESDHGEDLSLPRFDSETVSPQQPQPVEAESHAAGPATARRMFASGLDNDAAAGRETRGDAGPYGGSEAVRAELGEPYISPSRMQALGAQEDARELPPEVHSPGVSKSRRIAAAMVMLMGLVVLVVLGSDRGQLLADRVKAGWSDLFVREKQVQTAAESVRERPPQRFESVPDPEPEPEQGVDTGAAVPDSTAPAVIEEAAPEIPPGGGELPAVEESPAADLQEVEVAEPAAAPTQPIAAAPVLPVAPPDTPPAEGWEAAVAQEKRRLDAQARQAFRRLVGEQHPDRPELLDARPEVASPTDSTVQTARVTELSSLELEPVQDQDQREDVFRSLKEIHVALLEGRWTAQGKPAIFLPSEITFCGQGETHAQITCWSVPQYVSVGRDTLLQKVEATLQGFSSKGDFELVYRAMKAPVDTQDDRLFWQTTEHRLWCRFAGAAKVSCADRRSGDAIELMRSPLSNNDNSVGVDSATVTTG